MLYLLIIIQEWRIEKWGQKLPIKNEQILQIGIINTVSRESFDVFFEYDTVIALEKCSNAVETVAIKYDNMKTRSGISLKSRIGDIKLYIRLTKQFILRAL